MGNVRNKQGRQFIGTREYVDMATGEAVKSEAIFKKKEIKINFIMMFLDQENMYEVLAGLGSSGKVLGFILKEHNDKDSMFYFTTSNKERMVADTGLSIGTVRSSVKEFANTNIICPVRGAEYMLNPKVFYKGSIDKRNEVIERYDRLRELYELKKIVK